MRVVINQIPALGQRTGVGHYTNQLYRFLKAGQSSDQISGFPTGWVRAACKAFVRTRSRLDSGGSSTGALDEDVRQAPGLRQHVFQHLRQRGRELVGQSFRRFCARGSFDLYHEPNFIPFPSDCPTVTTLHDLSVLLHPEWHPADRVKYYEEHFRRGVASCAHFLVVSDFCRQEVIETLSIPSHRVTRTYNGIRQRLGPMTAEQVQPILRSLGLPPRYLLYLGTIEPRKNIRLLMEAYCDLPERLRSAWPLLLVGNWGWNSADVARYLHEEARHRGVIHVGYLRDRDLSAVYNGARALVYPSWYEGFGLPPLEMMACGGAVLASTAGALVETVGGAAHLTHPGDFDGWRYALRRVIEDENWHHGLRQGVRAVARPFTWRRCAVETLRVYRALTGTAETAPDIAEPRVPCRVAG